MLSNDQKVETIAELIKAVRDYLTLKTEYLRLDATEKVVRLLKAATLAVIVITVGCAVLLFASLALACALAKSMGMVAALLVVAAIYLFALMLIYIFRKPWIEKPLVRRLAQMLLD